MPGRSFLSGASPTKEKFTGKERDADTGFDYFGARYYASGIGRFLTTDRFAHKYPNLTPYQYAANNPIRFIDVNGDSLNVGGLNKATQTALLNEWEDIMGLRLGINGTDNVVILENTPINYSITLGNGAKVNTSIFYVTGNKDGKHSELAKDFLGTAISMANTIRFTNGNEGSKATASNISIDINQINSFVKGTPKSLNNQTLGLGMVTLHELYHTIAGAYFANGKNYIGMSLQGDTKTEGEKGPTVEFMNKIRSELGANYGQRSQYHGTPKGIPWERNIFDAQPTCNQSCQVTQINIRLYTYIHF